MPGILIGTCVIKHNGLIYSTPVISLVQVPQTSSNIIEITFDQILDGTSVPATTAFAIVGKTISNVSIIGAVVSITVTVDFVYGDIFSVSYTKPLTNPLKSLATSSKADSFNNIPIIIEHPGFWMTIDTTIAGSAVNSFILGAQGYGVYNYYVDWGDGSAEEHIIVNTNVTHVYATPDTYQIKIRGTFPSIVFYGTGDEKRLLSIDRWGLIVWGSLNYSFRDCSNMVANYTDIPNFTNVVGAAYTFQDCTLFDGLVANWDVSHIVDMSFMFRGTRFNHPFTGWDTHSVTNFNGFLYQNTYFNQSLAGFDISAATNLAYILYNATAFSTANYDATLISWAAQTVNSGLINITFNGTQYSAGAAAAARLVLTSAPNNWLLYDGGQV
jgi:hypothetical protein